MQTFFRVTAFLVAFGATVVSVAALAGRTNPTLDVLAHFSPLYFAGAMAAALMWLAFGRSGVVTTGMVAVALLTSGALVVPEVFARLTAERARPQGETLKLIQFNVWAHNKAPDETADWILAQNADVLVLEEAYEGAAPIVRRVAQAYPYRTSCAEPNPDCGTIIFYRRPALAEGGAVSESRRPYLAAAWATLPGESGPFTVLATHYVWPTSPAQQTQIRRVVRTAEWFDKGSLIVAGDMNLTPWSAAMRRQDKALGLIRRTRALPSWPTRWFEHRGRTSPIPLLPIDHVYAGADWRTVSVKRGPMLGSDHYPVVVTFTRAPREPSSAGR